MAKMVLSILEDFKVDNLDILLKYIEHREPDQPLVTVCNHASTFDEPLLWGMLPLRVLWNPSLLRWTLSAEEVCFNNPFTRWFFGSGQGISIHRGSGIRQRGLDLAIDKLLERMHLFSLFIY